MCNFIDELIEVLERDIIDYIGIFSPIILSLVAIIISLWNSFWSQNLKKVQVNLLWDDLFNKFYITIRNTGKKTIVIESISLLAYKKFTEKLVLGTRNNAWLINEEKTYIKANEMVFYEPYYMSNYDVFSYPGHAFDVDDSNKDYDVFIKIVDIDGKKWISKTNFKLEEIDKLRIIALDFSINDNDNNT